MGKREGTEVCLYACLRSILKAIMHDSVQRANPKYMVACRLVEIPYDHII